MQIELGLEMRFIGLDCLHTEVQPLGDGFCLQSFSDHTEDFELTITENVDEALLLFMGAKASIEAAALSPPGW